jgi:hypothetical protein
MRYLRHRVALDTQHLCQNILGNAELVIVGQPAKAQQPARQPLFRAA